MTVSSSTTFEFDVNQIVLQAYRLAGLLAIQESLEGQDASLGSHGRDVLQRIVDHLATYGIHANAVKFEDVNMVAGQQQYTLPSSVLDVVDTAVYIDAGEDPDEADGQTVVKAIPREEWLKLSAKGTQGRPTLYYPHRSGSLTVYIWPQPDEAGTIRFQAHRLLGDVQDGAATVDLQRYWTDYLVWELAHQLSMGAAVTMGRTLYLGKQAGAKLRKCQGYARQRPSTVVRLDHPTPWRRA